MSFIQVGDRIKSWILAVNLNSGIAKKRDNFEAIFLVLPLAIYLARVRLKGSQNSFQAFPVIKNLVLSSNPWSFA